MKLVYICSLAFLLFASTLSGQDPTTDISELTTPLPDISPDQPIDSQLVIQILLQRLNLNVSADQIQGVVNQVDGLVRSCILANQSDLIDPSARFDLYLLNSKLNVNRLEHFFFNNKK
jgi:hypothetical protein